MTERQTTARPQLPHRKLVAYQVALELLTIVGDAEIRDAKLRDQALRAAKSAALNIAEAAARMSPADQARVFAIARGEAVEACAAMEIAALAGDARVEAFDACLPVAARLYALLTGCAGEVQVQVQVQVQVAGPGYGTT
jgi:four helix bundle protein